MNIKEKSPLAFSSFAVTILFLLYQNVSAKNMNGSPGQYKVANSETFATDFDDSREYFDVYSNPIKTLYSQVHWTGHGDIPIPDDIVSRFQGGKVMAITGYEVNQVMKDTKGEEVSVPITWAYNHHYMAFLLNSKNARIIQKNISEGSSLSNMGLSHGGETMWMADLPENDNDVNFAEIEDDAFTMPQVQFFSEGNGGEMRLSYHAYPKNYAQIIESPDLFHIVPMQIDTWNREMKNSSFIPGPMPSTSKIPPEAGYNGLLECPCTDRLPKEWAMTYSLTKNQECTGSILNEAECFDATKTVIESNQYQNKRVNDDTLPAGCSVSLHENGTAVSFWNLESKQENRLLESRKDSKVVGVVLGAVNLTVIRSNNERIDAVRIKLSGPADKWFGVGFGSDSMCVHPQADECPDGGPYAIIVSGDKITERKLGNHGPGSELKSSLTLLSNSVTMGIRSVVIARSLKGMNDNYYSFDPSKSTIEVIMAKGCGLEFSQHCVHSSNQLDLFPVNSPVGICQTGVEGTIGGNKFNKNRCPPFPQSDLLNQNNPTCHIQTYQGGLSCCRHGMYLLDKAQDVPWKDQILEYRLKFRFYFEEYKPRTQAASTSPSHQNLARLFWATDAGEYDIMPCSPGTPPLQCIQVLTSRWKVSDMLHDCRTRDASYCTGKGSKNETETAGIKLIYAGPHCHAPSCLSMELYNADSGELLCKVEPLRGTSETVFDELGFLQIPPCLWGSSSEGLIEPKLLPLNTTLFSIKRNNNTLPHTGEMALWQMRGIVVPIKKGFSDQTHEIVPVKKEMNLRSHSFRHLDP